MRPPHPLFPLAILVLIPSITFGQARPATSKPGRAAAPATKAAAAGKPQTYRVLKVVDGRTISISFDDKPLEVRLIGVELPVPQESKQVAAKIAKDGTDALAKLLKDKSVALIHEEAGDRVDERGRTLAYVFRAPDGLFINKELIRLGLAYAPDLPFSYLAEFQQVQQEARDAGRGYWGRGIAGARPTDGAGEAHDPAAQPEKSTARSRTKEKGDTSEPTVYITKTGSTYHASGCRLLPKNADAKPLAVAAQDHTPCPRCKPPTVNGDTESKTAGGRTPKTPPRSTAARKRAEAQRLMERMYQDSLNSSGPAPDASPGYGASPYP